MALVDELLPKVKANLILEHDRDDSLLEGYIKAAISYAESYQHLSEGYYAESSMLPTTEQAVIMLSGHFYESRDGSTAGFFSDNVQASQQVWNTVNLLLRLDRRWGV
ncbi:head-tail connector protein [Phosphitispora sp. TUW77]|uniref:head-tail connector protein n=1 Tax=Phosphitispora sp. TUW77 TaxID=3152361 RepID=UPI003AB5C7FE